MAAVRSCVCLLVILVHLQVTVSKPLFDWLLCDMVCDDDDDITSSASAAAQDDMFSMFFDCSDCPQRATTPKPAQAISVRLPAVPNGLSLNVTDNNGILQFILDAIPFMGQSQATTAAPASTPAATAAPAANTTAAAG